MLTCNAKVVRNLFASPKIIWMYNGNIVSSSGNPRMNSITGQLIFDDITTHNSGEYTCRVSITIPEAGIVDYYNETTIAATTESKRCNDFKN